MDFVFTTSIELCIKKLLHNCLDKLDIHFNTTFIKNYITINGNKPNQKITDGL